MTSAPSSPKIYHITHVDNLPSIATATGLVSDARRIASELSCSLVGMSTIKQRRLERIEVDCHPGTKVGEYVPFYFCPRSIMLYILRMGNGIIQMSLTEEDSSRSFTCKQTFIKSSPGQIQMQSLGLSAMAMQAPPSPAFTKTLPN